MIVLHEHKRNTQKVVKSRSPISALICFINSILYPRQTIKFHIWYTLYMQQLSQSFWLSRHLSHPTSHSHIDFWAMYDDCCSWILQKFKRSKSLCSAFRASTNSRQWRSDIWVCVRWEWRSRCRASRRFMHYQQDVAIGSWVHGLAPAPTAKGLAAQQSSSASSSSSSSSYPLVYFSMLIVVVLYKI